MVNETPAFWGKAKLAPDGTLQEWLPLAEHCNDVAATFRALTELPIIRHRLERATGTPLVQSHYDRLAVLALLHDIGKANLGFQGKNADPKAPRVGHIREIAPLLGDLGARTAQAICIETLLNWFQPRESLEGFLIASWSHHGTPIRFDVADRIGTPSRWWQARDGLDPFQAIKDLLVLAHDAFPGAFTSDTAPISKSPLLQHRFAGLVMLADWLGSHESFFPISRRKDFNPYDAAKRALWNVGLDTQTYQDILSSRSLGFAELFGMPPTPLQAAISELPVGEANNHLLILEAATGAGKTEAALARFFSLFEAGEVDGLYFALPTRVAARELYGRVYTYIEHTFPDSIDRPVVVLAVPGYARVDNISIKKILPDSFAQWVDDANQRKTERCWAAEHPKRFLAATVAVGTIDQALLSALQTRHAHLRSVCLDRSLLVVDEVHASDPYMRRLLKSLVEHHVGLGGHALLLSATLGSRVRAELTGRSLPHFISACNDPFPSLTDFSGELKEVSKEGSITKPKTVLLELLPFFWDQELLIPKLIEALRSGARVLVVLNTVARAVAFHRALEVNGTVPKASWFSCNGVICPHHGRFAPSDRELLDLSVSVRFGKGSDPEPLILIGTQTLEQSLDIDADLLVTDLCPMDVLLQRIGRLHRHERQRPDQFKQARCLIFVPEEQDFSNTLGQRGEPNMQFRKGGLGSVYEDLRVLQLTLNYIAENPIIHLPSENRRLVEEATHPERLSTLTGKRWLQHAQTVDGEGLAMHVMAEYALLTRLYDRDFGSFSFQEFGQTKARTRLGLDTLRLPLEREVESPFGLGMREVLIPGHLAPRNIDEETVSVVKTDSEETRLNLAGRSYVYSRFGLEACD